MTRHQYGISALVSQTSLLEETGGGVAKCRLFAKPVRTTFAVQWLTLARDFNRPFPSSLRPLYQNEVKCSAFDLQMSFHCNANKTRFHKKGCALSLTLKVRVFGTPKWPIYYHKHCPHARPTEYVLRIVAKYNLLSSFVLYNF